MSEQTGEVQTLVLVGRHEELVSVQERQVRLLLQGRPVVSHLLQLRRQHGRQNSAHVACHEQTVTDAGERPTFGSRLVLPAGDRLEAIHEDGGVGGGNAEAGAVVAQCDGDFQLFPSQTRPVDSTALIACITSSTLRATSTLPHAARICS